VQQYEKAIRQKDSLSSNHNVDSTASEHLPNSLLGGFNGAHNPDLENIMRSRFSDRFQSPENLNPNAGVEKHLPDDLRSKVESHFGYSLDNVQMRESSDVDSIGAKAYTKGSTIHFAPGQFQPESAIGQKMIGHEVAHVLQQANGGIGDAGELNLSDSHEHSADIHGDIISNMPSGGFSEAQAPLQAMPTMSTALAPVQGWGVGGALAWLKGKGKGQLEGEHEMLTRLGVESANKKLDKDDKISSKAKESMRYGARFNDVYDSKSNLAFVGRYVTHSDEYINQAHHGDLQFLHAMDGSGGTTKDTQKKMSRWAQFALDTKKNEKTNVRIAGKDKRFQDQNMLDYVLKTGGGDDPFQSMMLSTMIKKDELADIEATVARHDDMPKAEKQALRLQMIKSRLTEVGDDDTYNNLADDKKEKYKAKVLEGRKSSYAKQSISQFFKGTGKDASKIGFMQKLFHPIEAIRRHTRDAGDIALGSMSHMIEDSFARSHGQRSYNSKSDANKENDVDITNGDAVLNTLSPMQMTSNYDEQNEDKHAKADYMMSGGFFRKTAHVLGQAGRGLLSILPFGRKFGNFLGRHSDKGHLKRTEGAKQSRDVVAHMLYSVNHGESSENLLNFFNKATAVDKNADIIQQIQAIKKGPQKEEAVLQDEIAALTDGSDLSGIDFIQNDVSTTRSGRQFSKNALGAKNGKGELLNNDAKIYEGLLETKERTNRKVSPVAKLGEYTAQINALGGIMNHEKSADTRAEVKKHATEILLHLSSMKSTQGAGDRTIIYDPLINEQIALCKNIINKPIDD